MNPFASQLKKSTTFLSFRITNQPNNNGNNLDDLPGPHKLLILITLIIDQTSEGGSYFSPGSIGSVSVLVDSNVDILRTIH